jgi:hypothetical protein
VGDRDEDVIALTHVCQAWREVFVSRSSLWTNFCCWELKPNKTRVYLERSKSSPIKLRLGWGGCLPPRDPFFQVVPHAISRLKSLIVHGTPGNLQDVTARLTRPAPLLEYLWIDGDCCGEEERNPVLATTLFNGDLVSLRELHLQSVRTELPWRNMVNLTSFTLGHTLRDAIPIERLLDFFESAPHLRKIELRSATLTSHTQNGRLVSLDRLEKMDIIGNYPPSILLGYLMIPVGAELTTQVGLHDSPIENHLPRSLDNLRNLPGFTDIHLHIGEHFSRIRLSGPNGQVRMVPRTSQLNTTSSMLDSLARFDTSGTKHLEIYRGHSLSRIPPYRALLPMKHLRTLTLSRCTTPNIFIHALDPSASLSGIVVCPKLDELVLVLRRDGETLDVDNVIEMAAARASRGAKLESIKIIDHHERMQIDTLELEKHASHVECSPGVGVANEYGGSGDEGGWRGGD